MVIPHQMGVQAHARVSIDTAVQRCHYRGLQTYLSGNAWLGQREMHIHSGEWCKPRSSRVCDEIALHVFHCEAHSWDASFPTKEPICFWKQLPTFSGKGRSSWT